LIGSSGDSDKTTTSGKRGKKKRTEDSAPPGYIQSLINKIVTNVQVKNFTFERTKN
jgi:hypothetical protein